VKAVILFTKKSRKDGKAQSLGGKKTPWKKTLIKERSEHLCDLEKASQANNL
jgi:hypothetical protein